MIHNSPNLFVACESGTRRDDAVVFKCRGISEKALSLDQI